MGKREQFGAAGTFALICLFSGSALWVGATLFAGSHSKGIQPAAVQPAMAQLKYRAAAQEQIIKQFAMSPAVFVQNVGQCEDQSIRFAHQGQGANALIGDDGICLQIFATEDTESTENAGLGNNSETRRKTEAVWMRFPGADKVMPVGEGLATTRFNYHLGADPTKWIDGAPCYESVVYKNLYPGIDLVVRGLRSKLKYEFHVAPRHTARHGGQECGQAGADYRRIQIHYDGIDQLKMNANGTLEARLTDGTSSVVDGKPVAYQEIDGRRQDVAGRFRLLDSSTCGFEMVSAVSPDHALIIDPDLVWGTYLGGNGKLYDAGNAIATDLAGNCFVTGNLYGSNFRNAGSWDVFVTKLNRAGYLLWTTFLGGSGDDFGYGVATDAAGNCFVTGQTYSAGWVRGECDSSYNGNGDAFVAKLSRSGRVLWSSYLGGKDYDVGCGVATDGFGNCYVTGDTYSRGWVRRGFDTSYNGGWGDAFVAKLSSSGSHIWSTYLGGDDWDLGNGLATDGSGNCYVTGSTESSGWVSGGFDTTYNRGGDAFVVKLAGDGAHLWSTYLGGSDFDWGNGVAADAAGNCYVTGSTYSDGWVSGGFHTRIRGERDAFLVKLAGDGAHLWSTYLGGKHSDWGNGIATDRFGSCYVTGNTFSSNWLWGGYNAVYSGAYVLKIGTGCMLRVQSLPRNVPITGTPAGTTNYAHKCDHGSLVSLKAAATALRDYVFTQWSVNGRRQNYGMTSISFTIRQGTTAEPMYNKFASLGIIGRSTVNEGSGTQYRCYLYCKDGSVCNITHYAAWSENSPSASFTKPGYLKTTSVSSDTVARIAVKYAGRVKTKYVTIKNR